jgi:hypothetical protein
MHDMVTAKYRPKHNSRKRRQNRHLGMPTQQPCPFFTTAIAGLHNKPGAPGLQPFPRLLKSAHRLPGPPCQPQEFANPT